MEELLEGEFGHIAFPALWRANVGAQPDAPLVTVDDERLTYGEADARARRLAKGLIAAGAGKGSHVGLLFPNSPDFVVGLIATLRIGAVALPFSTLSTADELGWLLVNSDAGFLLAAPRFRGQNFAAMLPDAVPGLDPSAKAPLRLPCSPWLRRVAFSGGAPGGYGADWTIAALEELGEDVPDALLEAAEARVDPSNWAVIVHTSGSTSKPKGVIHRHGSMIRHLTNINSVRGLGTGDTMFTTSPWFWVAGFAFGLVGTLVAGSHIVCSNETDPAKILDVVERERPNMTNGYSPLASRYAADPSFAARDFSFIEKGNLHALLPSPIRPADPDLRHNIYGMTEVCSALTMSADETDQPEHRRGSLGHILPGFAYRIADPETLADCPPGEVGQLWLRGPLMMEGYYGRERSEVFRADGWWRSGDLCRVDADGFFFIAGRLGDMIKTAGANVAPKEVEAVLRLVTGAGEAIVLGLPDAERGEVVAAFVIGTSFDEGEAIRACGERLSRYKVPRRILPLDQGEVPMLSSGKPDMAALRALAQERW